MVMTHSKEPKRSATQRGFSLAELMVAMAVLLVVIGGVLQLLNQSQQRYVSTANIEDSTAMAREAVDLMARDLRLAGYPPPNSYPTGVIGASNQQYIAIGGGFLGTAPPPDNATAPSPYSIRFEADIGIPAGCGVTPVPPGILMTDYRCTSNTGVVSVIDYQLQVPTGGATGGCAGLTVEPTLTSPTLMRSQVLKNADGTAPAPVFTPFVSDVMNCRASTSVATPEFPIFTYCRPAVPAGGCPDLSGQKPSTLPAPRNTRAVLIRLQVQTRTRDPQTQQFQIVEFYSVAQRLNPDS